MGAVDLSDLTINFGSDAYYNDTLRNAVEDNLVNLRVDNTTKVLTVTPDQGLRNAYDFYGLLLELQVDPQLHWIMLRLNNYTSPMQYDGTVLQLLAPQIGTIDKIRQLNVTTVTIST